MRTAVTRSSGGGGRGEPPRAKGRVPHQKPVNYCRRSLSYTLESGKIRTASFDILRNKIFANLSNELLLRRQGKSSVIKRNLSNFCCSSLDCYKAENEFRFAIVGHVHFFRSHCMRGKFSRVH